MSSPKYCDASRRANASRTRRLWRGSLFLLAVRRRRMCRRRMRRTLRRGACMLLLLLVRLVLHGGHRRYRRRGDDRLVHHLRLRRAARRRVLLVVAHIAAVRVHLREYLCERRLLLAHEKLSERKLEIAYAGSAK